MKILNRHKSTAPEPDNRRYLRTSKTAGWLRVRYAPRDELPQHMDTYWLDGGEDGNSE